MLVNNKAYRLRHFATGILVGCVMWIGATQDQELFAASTGSEAIMDCSDSPSHHVIFWQDTDFSKCVISLDEVRSGGPGKDGIPSIDAPIFLPSLDEDILSPDEPVISIEINGEARAWPLRILTWHEIVNDHLGGVPIAVTYCPLCNAAIIFERRLDGQILHFGTTGNLRNSDLIMYDRQTESWWQQYTGQAIIGSFAGKHLKMLPSRLESWAQFLERHPDSSVLQPPQPVQRAYGTNPYIGYDTSGFPFLFSGAVPDNIKPLERVIVVDNAAWSLAYIMAQGHLKVDDLDIRWKAGQNSALDTSYIQNGRDVGTITVQREESDGTLHDVVHHVTFAFVFHAFNPETPIITP